MDFEERLRAHLEGVGRGAPFPSEPVRHVDEEDLHRHLLARLESGDLPEWAVVSIHAEWPPEELARFARYLETSSSPVIPTDAEGINAFARRALNQVIDGGSTSSVVEGLELARLVRGFRRRNDEIKQYAIEVGLAKRDQLTNLGQVFLSLHGKDAVRWVLTAETLQSTGQWDEWRVSRRLLEEARNHGLDNDGLGFTYAERTLDRLSDLNVFVRADRPSGEPYGYDVRSEMQDVVDAVLEHGAWHTAIAALLQDERPQILQPPSTVAADATIEQTRLIAHEVRNALVPVRIHIDTLMSSNMEPRLEAARRGVVRVLTFVEQMVATSEMITERPVTLDLLDLVRASLGYVEGGEGVQVVEPLESIAVRAPRTRLARAVANVVSNALQSASPPPVVRVSLRRCGTTVEVIVDDAGPGVPPDQRTRVFDDGYTTRAGGSGFGLAFVRSIVEGSLRGRVSCEASELGGARFVLAFAEGTES